MQGGGAQFSEMPQGSGMHTPGAGSGASNDVGGPSGDAGSTGFGGDGGSQYGGRQRTIGGHISIIEHAYGPAGRAFG